MDHLPLEIIRCICLLARDHDLCDVYSVRLVNRSCCLAATPVAFENLTIKLRAGTTTHDLLTEFNDSGPGRYSRQYARRLNLVCIRHWLPSQTTRGLEELAPNLFGHIPRAANDGFLEPHLTTAGVPGSDYEKWKWVFNFYNPPSWQPLVDLIAMFYRLVELNYALADMFPRSLGEAVRNYHPDCNLNIWNGYLPNETSSLSQRLTPNALASLNPRSFVAVCPAQNLVTSNDIYTNLLRQILPGLSACLNLKHLTIHWGNSTLNGLYEEIVQAWGSHPQSTCPVQLRSLTLQGSTPLTNVLYAMARLFDLSDLSSLDLTALSNPYIIREASLRLKRLRALYVSMDPDFSLNAPRDNQETVHAILSMNPLQFLCLRGVRKESTLHEILAAHGSTLRGLILEVVQYGSSPNGFFSHPEMNQANISKIAGLCPNLQELRLPLKRTMGDRFECVKYRTLGEFSQLRTLVIDLMCDPRHQDPFERVLSMTGRIKSALINAATDRHLVESIWNVIFSAQPSKRLRQLSCIHTGSACYPWPQEWVMLHLAQSFLVRRHDFDTIQPVEILPIGNKSVALRMEEKYRTGHRSGMESTLRKIFDELWPGEGPWETRWRSFPLDTCDDCT
ncbi:hypothetical protein BJY01DRAFT_137535 [Aspergillus pseudoustus]|uniref:F-box domain-containing protein n=1 Tax=Aspergillus pseudoustus TaxID=1810923 RepID=A0ABR4KYX6_9EURO